MRLGQLQPVNQLSLLQFVMDDYDSYISFQNLAEFWVVASRPVESNGLGLTIEAVAERVKWIRGTFNFVPENQNAIDVWIELCKTNRIAGKRAHDARLASVAIANDISVIITRNASDFKSFQGISVVEPPDGQQN